MGSIKCTKCGTSMGTTAKSCPTCGASPKEQIRRLGCIGKVCLILVLLGLTGNLLNFCTGTGTNLPVSGREQPCTPSAEKNTFSEAPAFSTDVQPGWKSNTLEIFWKEPAKDQTIPQRLNAKSPETGIDWTSTMRTVYVTRQAIEPFLWDSLFDCCKLGSLRSYSWKARYSLSPDLRSLCTWTGSQNAVFCLSCSRQSYSLVIPNKPSSMTTECSLQTHRDNDCLCLVFQGSWTIHSQLCSFPDIHPLLTPPVKTLCFNTEKLDEWDSRLLIELSRITDLAVSRSIATDDQGLPAGVRNILQLTRKNKDQSSVARENQKPGSLPISETAQSVFFVNPRKC